MSKFLHSKYKFNFWIIKIHCPCGNYLCIEYISTKLYTIFTGYFNHNPLLEAISRFHYSLFCANTNPNTAKRAQTRRSITAILCEKFNVKREMWNEKCVIWDLRFEIWDLRAKLKWFVFSYKIRVIIFQRILL